MTWAPIPGFSRYLVSDDGRVQREGSSRVLAPQPNDSGYLEVKIFDDYGSRRWVPIHTLVLVAFVGPRPTPKHHAAHGVHGPWCNHVKNLRWATPHENEADKKLVGTQPKGGARVPTHANTVRAIRFRYRLGESLTQLARRFGLHRSSVARIATGKRRA